MTDPFTPSPGQAHGYNDNGHCLKVGVLTNPRSGGNKKGGREVHRLLENWPDVIHREATNPDSISDALADFSRNGVELLVINGGDGTVQATLTILGTREIFASPPLLSLLCAGTTSMLPRDVGVAGRPPVALQRILEWSKSAHKDLVIRSRPILRIQKSTETLFGMFFGAGAICEGIRIFHSKDNPMGWRGQLMPMMTMLRLLLAILLNRRDMVRPLLNSTGLNGQEPAQRVDLLVLASTLDRLFLGMRPYWGNEQGPLHYTAVDIKQGKMLRVLFSLFRPGVNRHATPANGYSSHNVEEVRLTMDGDFTLDGELYAAEGATVVITSAGPAHFLCSC